MMYGPTREPAVSGMGAVYDEAGPGVAAGHPSSDQALARTYAGVNGRYVDDA